VGICKVWRRLEDAKIIKKEGGDVASKDPLDILMQVEELLQVQIGTLERISDSDGARDLHTYEIKQRTE